MVELVDTRDLKSLAFERGGSTPPSPTKLSMGMYESIGQIRCLPFSVGVARHLNPASSQVVDIMEISQHPRKSAGKTPHGSIAQQVEHRTFNPQVPSSSLGRPTTNLIREKNVGV